MARRATWSGRRLMAWSGRRPVAFRWRMKVGKQWRASRALNASWMLECGYLDVEVEQRIDLVLVFQAPKVEEEMEVDIQLPVEGLLPVELKVADEKYQVLDEVRQVWKCLGVVVHEVLEGQHLDVVVHVDHEKRTQDPL